MLCGIICLGAIALRAQESIAVALAMQQSTPGQSVHGRPAAQDAIAEPLNVTGALEAIYRQAGAVFTGEVLSIERQPGAVVVRWRVEDAVLGVTGAVYTEREWDGLWSDGRSRYVVGERALVMLLAASVGGYASPVSGMDGVIPLRGDAASSVMDLRWISQQVHRNGSQAAGSGLFATSNQAEFVKPQTRSTEAAGGEPGMQALALVDGGLVMNMLHAWKRTENGKP